MADVQTFTTRTAAQLLDDYRITLFQDNGASPSTPYSAEIIELAAKFFSLLEAGDLPNLPASIITSGAFDDARIPSSIARDSEVTNAINALNIALLSAIDELTAADVGADVAGTAAAAIAAHLLASNPHPEYTTAAELAEAIADFITDTDTRLSDTRTPTDGSVTNAKVATDAAIAWTKISKSGAAAADVGADPAGTASGLVSAITPASIGAASTGDLSAAIAGTQPLDSDLTAIAALTTTSYGRALLTLANQAALLTATGAQSAIPGYSNPSGSNIALEGSLTAGGDIVALSTGSTQASPRRFGFGAFAAGAAVRFFFGDDFSGIQNGNGTKTTFYAFHGIIISGARSQSNAPAYGTGGGGSDICCQVLATNNGAVALEANSSAGGTVDIFRVIKQGTTHFQITSAGTAIASSLLVTSKTIPDATYTVIATDAGKTLIFTNATGVALTVPSGLPAGFGCEVLQSGAGQITVTGTSNRQGHTKSAGVDALCFIRWKAANTYVWANDTAA